DVLDRARDDVIRRRKVRGRVLDDPQLGVHVEDALGPGHPRRALVDDHVAGQRGRLGGKVVVGVVRGDLDVLVLDDDFLAALPVLVLLESDWILRVETDLAPLLRRPELDLEVGTRLEARLEGVDLAVGILCERRDGEDQEEDGGGERGAAHASMARSGEASRNAASVFARISSTPTPGASSLSSRPAPSGRTSNTQWSVMM